MTAQESKLSNAYESTITTALTADASGTTISVDTAPTDSTNTAITGSVVMYLVLDPDSDSQREYVKVTNISGTTLTVVRNIDTGGGGLRTHAAGAKIRQVAQAQHFDDIHDRIDKVINEDGSSLNTTTGVVKDEDDMASDSATHLATQQSIKAYVDSQVTAQDLDFQGDSGGALSIDLDSETLTIAGGTGIDTTGSGNQVSVDIDSTVTTNSGSQTLTNKTIDVDNNTVSNIEVDNLKSGVLDTDISTTSASDDTLPSAKAVKTYVDSQVTAQDLDIVADTGTDSIDLDSETLTIAGGTGLDTTSDGAGTVTVDIDSTVTTNSGSQTLTNKTIDVDNNTVSNIEVDNLKSGVLDTDLTSVSASDDTLASAKAIKTYVDNQIATEDTIAELNDTNVVSPAAGHVLIYDATSGLWDNNTLTAGTNVTITNADGSITIASTDTNTQLSQEQVEDYVAGLITAGSNVSVTYDDTAGTLTIASTDTQLTQEQVEDYVAGVVTAGSNISVTYDDTAGTLTIAATDTQLTQEQVEDYVAGVVTAGSGISVTYDDTAGTLTIANTASTSTEEVQDIVGDMLVTNGTHTGISFAYDDAGDGAIDATVSLPASDEILDADGDTKIQVEESADEDIIRFDTAGVERATLQGALDLTDNGGAFIHSQTQAGTYTVASGKGTLFAGPITITGTVTNAGTMVVI